MVLKQGQTSPSAELLNNIWGPERQIASTTQEDIKDIRELLHTIRPIERKVLSLRFGLKDGEKHSFREVGQRLGFSGSHAEHLQEAALEKLREGWRMKSPQMGRILRRHGFTPQESTEYDRVNKLLFDLELSPRARGILGRYYCHREGTTVETVLSLNEERLMRIGQINKKFVTEILEKIMRYKENNGISSPQTAGKESNIKGLIRNDTT